MEQQTAWLIDTKEGFTPPTVRNFGIDGNAFALMAQVSSALKREGHADVAKEFCTRALHSHSYEEMLFLCGEYGDLEPYVSEEGDDDYEEDEGE